MTTEVDQPAATPPGPASRRGDDLFERSNLTRSQFLIWTGQKLNPSIPLYNMILAYRIEGSLDPSIFARAHAALLEQTDAMRTVVEEDRGVPRQRVLDAAPSGLEHVDLSGEAAPDAAFEIWLEQRRFRMFELDACLFDSALVRLGPESHVWYLNQHHLITDGWSKAVVYRRMAVLYAAARDDAPMIDEGAAPYRDYIEFERAYREKPAYARARAHWNEKLADLPEPPRFFGRVPASAGPRTERIECDLGAERTRRLKEAATDKRLRSLTESMGQFNILATVLIATVHRLSGERRVVIGAPSHNRPSASHKQTAGLFIEIQPLDAEIEEDETYETLYRKVAAEANLLLRHAHPGTGDFAANHAYSVLLNFINAAFDDFAGLSMSSRWVHCGHGDRGHALRLQVHDFDQSGRFRLQFDLNEDLFDDAARGWVIEQFLAVLDSFLDDCTQRLDDVDLLTASQHERLVDVYNRTDAPYPQARTVLEAFAEQARREPDAVAIEDPAADRTLTRGQLLAQAEALATALAARGAGRGSLVPICAERSSELLVAILGVLGSGAAYVPLEPDHPDDHAQRLVEDAGATIVLATAAQADRFEGRGQDVIRVDLSDRVAAAERTPAFTAAERDDLAYAIYTSGSTGVPKGVMIEHGSLLNYIAWAQSQYLDDHKPATFPLYSSVAFDLTVTSIFVPLISGGRIRIYPKTDRGPDRSILNVLEEDAVEVLKLTPAHLTMMRDLGLHPRRLSTLIVGGDDLRTDLARSIHERCEGRVAIYNEYGPTEATVGCMIHRFDPHTDRGTSVPIGRPAANARVYLLDARQRPVAPGAEGEIFIAGDGVARGYHGQRELTAERFVDDPFRPGARAYRSGDLGRWVSDGVLVYAGRADRQVKIRGFRVEPGAIEAALAAHESVRDCVIDIVSDPQSDVPAEPGRHCVRCGLASNVPHVTFDDEGVCSQCGQFETDRLEADAYFRSMDELEALCRRIKTTATGRDDSMMLLSGGKDSTYALYRIVELDLHPLVFSLDNGFISDGAKDNIRRAVDDLGLELVFARPDAMNEIFRDSLDRFSNVCNGCFKTIYTLSMKLARERGIRHIFTGLSRGQFFETRIADLFKNRMFDPALIDRSIIEARKAYHRADDAVRRHLDTAHFDDDAIFDEIEFVDFYRYCEVELDEMLAFIERRAPWIRPRDTGRSTNCLINDLGIHVHRRERGFHSYALPYAWDVRLGHKQRDAALEELDDDLDEARIHRMMDEVGYTLKSRTPGKRIAAWFVPNAEVTTEALRDHLERTLPEAMIPAWFVELDEMPLTPNGKIDRAALPAPDFSRRQASARVADTGDGAPRNSVERRLAGIWASVLGVERVSIHDHFLEIGGDSITNILITARANQAGLSVTPNQMFEHPTIAELAGVVTEDAQVAHEQSAISGPAALAPMQHWFFEQDLAEPDHWNQAYLLELEGETQGDRVEAALRRLLDHHDVLRARFTRTGEGWTQTIDDAPRDFELRGVDLSGADDAERERVIEREIGEAQRRIRLEAGQPFVAVHFKAPDRLLLMLHHLVVDGLSWRFLLEDLQTLLHHPEGPDSAVLAAKTTSWQKWTDALSAWAKAPERAGDLDFWVRHLESAPADLKVDDPKAEAASNTEDTTRRVTVTLDPDESERLLHEVPRDHHAQLTDILVAALARTVTTWSGSPTLLVDLESHGRELIDEGINLLRTAGWFSALYPAAVTLPAPAVGGPAADLKSVKEQLRGIPDRGLGHGALRHLAGPDVRERLTRLPAPSIFMNYLGPLDQVLPPGGKLRLARPIIRSQSPRGRRPHAWEINAFQQDGRFHVDWIYNDRLHRPETIEKLAGNLLQHLRAIIDPNAQSAAVTASDFPLANLDDSKLDKLSALLKKADKNAKPK